MGSDQNFSPRKIICIMCLKSDETIITGPLSTKENVSAHQNCLLFASGIFCKNSPTYDDLFGFAVEDVKSEKQRGSKLRCHRCKKKGATVGCEEKRCRRSYHYPCAIDDRARADEDWNTGKYSVFCKLHDPQRKDLSLQEASPFVPNGNGRFSAGIHNRRESDSSTGSSEGRVSSQEMEYDDTEINNELAPLESDIEEFSPPQGHNQSSASEPEIKRPCNKLNPSAKDLLKRGSTSDQKACGSTDNSGELDDSGVLDSPISSLEVETPVKKRKIRSVFPDEQTPPSTDPAAPDVSDPDEPEDLNLPKQSTPVPEESRPLQLSPSVTGAVDDTDIDSDESQSLLTTVPCNIIVDSGTSVESENSADPCCTVASTSSGSVTNPKCKETPSTSRTPVMPRALTFDTDPVPHQEHVRDVPSEQPRPPTGDTPEQWPEASAPAGVSTSPDRPAAEDVCDGETRSSAAIFWTRCNQAGCTNKIFSELMSLLSGLGERVQSEEASPQDFEVALKLLEASGRLPCIIAQLEQDLEKQEQELLRKKTALRDARTALGF